MPKVSVITGFYNRVGLLERTIESILNQTFDDFELIVFDDCSSDGTAARLRDLSVEYNDPRFKYIVHESNRGFVRGLTDAISASTGEYIAIQGSGDVSLPDRLRLQTEVLDSRPEVGVVGGWYFNVQEDQGTRRLRTPDANGFSFESLLSANVYTHGEVMIRRSTYDQVGGYRTAFKFAQDRDLWFRISKVSRLATVLEPVYDRYVQWDGVSYVPEKRAMQACYSIAAKRLAQMSPDDEAEALAVIEAKGPTAIVGTEDPVIQRILIHSALRMVLFGSPAYGIETARKYVISPWKRRALIVFARIAASRISRPVRPLVFRALGIKPE